jgi:Cu+-exporting ATPase
MKTELAVGGMTCASCVRHVTRALEKVPGVGAATVNLATEQATIEHDAGVSEESLVAAVVRAGYHAEPVAAGILDGAAGRRDAAIRRKARLLIVALALFIPTLVLGMIAGEFPGKDWVMLALTIPVWAVVGADFHRGALSALRARTATMDTLVSLGSTAALGYSIYATIAMVPSYAEAASAIVTLVYAGKYLEALAKGRSDRAVRALLDLRPLVARRLDPDGAVREVPADVVRPGDRIVVAPGDRLAVDGVVIDGTSSVDVSALTGEPIPIEAGPGAIVRAGTVNGDGTLTVRASAVGAGTTLARIVEIVRRAQSTTPPVQRLADRVAGIFVPAILAVALATFAGWILAGRPWPAALVAAVAVLVVACPCALGLATPTAIVVAAGSGARRGILFRDAVALERLARVDTVLFDKTGTLTEGRPAVVAVAPFDGVSEERLLAVAAALERGSSHPLAGAVVRAAEERALAPLAASEAVAARGQGVRALVDGAPAFAGSPAFLATHGVAVPALDGEPHTQIAVSQDGRFLGMLALADEPRATSAEAIAELHALGVRTRVVSGDAVAATAALAARLGVDGYDAEVSPEGKAALVEAERMRGRLVAFVGDGINDAPALASADVGLAMGSGTDVAMETAQAALLTNDPRAVAAAIRLARATLRTIAQNLFWAFAYNVVLVPLAAFGVVRPVYAAAAMGLSSVFVVGNSLLLRRRS